MSDVNPEPVSPRRIEVNDLGAFLAALGIPPPPSGARTIEVELLPGRIATVVEVAGAPNTFVYVCTPDLAAARQYVDENLGTAQWGPDSVDPHSMRTRGCILHGGGVVIDAVHCPQAEESGVPCRADCSPSLSFE